MTPELALELVCGRLQMFFPQGWDDSREALLALGYTEEQIDEAVRKYLGN